MKLRPVHFKAIAMTRVFQVTRTYLENDSDTTGNVFLGPN